MTGPQLETGWHAHQRGDLDQAERIYGEILRFNPLHVDALYLLGIVRLQRGQFAEAEQSLSAVLRANPASHEAAYACGCALQGLERHADAISRFDHAVVRRPNLVDAWIARGVSLERLGRTENALASFEKALACNPRHAQALFNRANALQELKRQEDALAAYAEAIAVEPRHFAAWNNLGTALLEMGRNAQALSCFDSALEIAPESAGASNNRGNALLALQRSADAFAAFEQTLAIDPQNCDALINIASLCLEQRRLGEAIDACRKVLAIDPDYKNARGLLTHCKLHCCDWRTLSVDRHEITEALRAGKSVSQPFANLFLSESPQDQLTCSTLHVQRECPPVPSKAGRARISRDGKIRVAYVSGDFRVHPTPLLMGGVFEHHDRNKFEISAASFGPDDGSAIRRRVMRSFESFIEVQDKSDAQVASLLREMEVDIAVDLMGFSGKCRTGIFAHRAAPIQVNYLGYPGSMGADYIDYIIADRTLIPAEHRDAFVEKIAYLPDSYQANDSRRNVSGGIFRRADANLPESCFVFCCFNQSYKITPEIFEIWMRLLSAIPDSVLWLLKSNEAEVRNLGREAQAKGVAGERLVFAPVLPVEEHAARLPLADLFLDTLPCNAHTTASDALWMGLPLLTCAGDTFAGRVAASLLNAVGLPELVTESLEDYEAMALKLARDKERLAAVKATLKANRDKCPLFDTARFTRHLETAFTTMWERYQKGEPPADFAVQSTV